MGNRGLVKYVAAVNARQFELLDPQPKLIDLANGAQVLQMRSIIREMAERGKEEELFKELENRGLFGEIITRISTPPRI